jgi:hypothetical protein
MPHLHRPPVPRNSSWPPIRSHPPTFSLPTASLGGFPPNPSPAAPKSEREEEWKEKEKGGDQDCRLDAEPPWQPAE